VRLRGRSVLAVPWHVLFLKSLAHCPVALSCLLGGRLEAWLHVRPSCALCDFRSLTRKHSKGGRAGSGDWHSSSNARCCTNPPLRCGGGVVPFTVTCSDPRVAVDPRAGLLRCVRCAGDDGACSGGGSVSGSTFGGAILDRRAAAAAATAAAIADPSRCPAPALWLRVSLCAREAGPFLRRGALELEFGPSGRRRAVPFAVPPNACAPAHAAAAPTATPVAAAPASSSAASAAAVTPLRPRSPPSPASVYFKGTVVNFGVVAVGASLTRKLRLCNAAYAAQDGDGVSEREGFAEVELRGAGGPFLLRHHHLSIRPRAYVKVPVAFAPCVRGDFEVVLAAHIAGRRACGPRSGLGETPCTCTITLVGTAV